MNQRGGLRDWTRQGALHSAPALEVLIFFYIVFGLCGCELRPREGSGEGVSDCSRAVVPVGRVVTGSE